MAKVEDVILNTMQFRQKGDVTDFFNADALKRVLEKKGKLDVDEKQLEATLSKIEGSFTDQIADQLRKRLSTKFKQVVDGVAGIKLDPTQKERNEYGTLSSYNVLNSNRQNKIKKAMGAEFNKAMADLSSKIYRSDGDKTLIGLEDEMLREVYSKMFKAVPYKQKAKKVTPTNTEEFKGRELSSLKASGKRHGVQIGANSKGEQEIIVPNIATMPDDIGKVNNALDEVLNRANRIHDKNEVRNKDPVKRYMDNQITRKKIKLEGERALREKFFRKDAKGNYLDTSEFAQQFRKDEKSKQASKNRFRMSLGFTRTTMAIVGAIVGTSKLIIDAMKKNAEKLSASFRSAGEGSMSPQEEEYYKQVRKYNGFGSAKYIKKMATGLLDVFKLEENITNFVYGAKGSKNFSKILSDLKNASVYGKGDVASISEDLVQAVIAEGMQGRTLTGGSASVENALRINLSRIGADELFPQIMQLLEEGKIKEASSSYENTQMYRDIKNTALNSKDGREFHVLMNRLFSQNGIEPLTSKDDALLLAVQKGFKGMSKSLGVLGDRFTIAMGKLVAEDSIFFALIKGLENLSDWFTSIFGTAEQKQAVELKRALSDDIKKRELQKITQNSIGVTKDAETVAKITGFTLPNDWESNIYATGGKNDALGNLAPLADNLKQQIVATYEEEKLSGSTKFPKTQAMMSAYPRILMNAMSLGALKEGAKHKGAVSMGTIISNMKVDDLVGAVFQILEGGMGVTDIAGIKSLSYLGNSGYSKLLKNMSKSEIAELEKIMNGTVLGDNVDDISSGVGKAYNLSRSVDEITFSKESRGYIEAMNAFLSTLAKGSKVEVVTTVGGTITVVAKDEEGKEIGRGIFNLKGKENDDSGLHATSTAVNKETNRR